MTWSTPIVLCLVLFSSEIPSSFTHTNVTSDAPPQRVEMDRQKTPLLFQLVHLRDPGTTLHPQRVAQSAKPR